MKDKTLRKAMQTLQDNRCCETCPIDATLCRQISNAIFMEERCLIVVSLSEVLAFRTEEAKKAREAFKQESKGKRT